MTSLTRKQESMIRSLSTRHGRKESGLCFCDGIRSGGEILNLRPDLVEFLILREGTPFPTCPEGSIPDEKTVILPEREFQRISEISVSQGMIVVARRPEPLPEDAPLSGPFTLILDKVGDPGNLGTIIRTSRAAGLKEIWLTDYSADPFSDKVIRSASGAQFSVAIRHGGNLTETAELLKSKGVKRFFRTTPGGGKSIYKEALLYQESAVILGSEGAGADQLEGACDVIIPMPGDAESLNVAQAATIMLFEYVRRWEEQNGAEQK